MTTRIAGPSPADRPGRGRQLNAGLRHPVIVVSLSVLVLFGLAAVLAPVLPIKDPFNLSVDVLQAPSKEHFFGTDSLGRDLFSRILMGARTSLLVGFGAIGMSGIAGGLLGLISGYWGGRIDMVIQRMVDVIIAFPGLVLLIVLVMVLGAGILNIVLALAFGRTVSVIRIVRSSTLGVKENQYIEAARSIGATDWRILFKHILPQCVAPWIIVVTAGVGSVIVAEASLSFLGLGIPEPNPSWGRMLSGDAKRFMEQAPWLAIFPGLVLTFVVYSFNMFGDALRDILDPRLRL